MDLISVIMPFYKKREYFVESFFSVANQSYKNIEIIVIYDDDDVNDLKFINDEVSADPRVTVINNNSNYGVAKSRNIGINNSKGKFIAFLDCDDIWKKNKLEMQYNFMSKNKLRISHTSYNIINSENEVLGTNIAAENLTYNDLINSCDIGLSTVMVDSDVFKVAMFKDLKTKEDYALWLELSRKGEVFSALDKTLTLWRRSSNSLSSSFIDKFINGFKVYNKFEKKNLLMSFFLVINLGLNYLKKRIKQKKRL